MSRPALLALGVRTTVLGGRDSRTRVGLMAGGMAVGVALILGLLSVLPAWTAHQERGWARSVGGSADAEHGATVEGTQGPWRGRTVTTYYVATDGPVRSLPAGLDRLPAAGEVVVSPAMARALDTAPEELRPRVPGRVVGSVTDEGLRGPDELLAWVGVPREALAPGLLATDEFGFSLDDVEVVPSDLRVAVGVAAIALLVPVLVLVATLARLSAATRERRLAAVRLVGATRREARWFAAAETGVAAALGVVTGVGVFLALRGPVVDRFPVDEGVFVSDVAPPLWQVAAVAVAVPLLAVAVSLGTLRRVLTSPLAVTRQAAPRAVGWWRPVPLVLGLALLAGARFDRDGVVGGDVRGAVLLLGGAALSLAGLAVAAPAVTRLTGALLNRLAPGPGSQLAARRILADPGAGARTLTGTVLVVATGVWLLGFLPVLVAAWDGSQAEEAEALRPGTLVAEVVEPGHPANADPVPTVRAVDGVTTVAALSQVRLASPGDDAPFNAVVGDCADIAALLRSPVPDCRSGTAYRLDGRASGDRSTGPHPGQQVEVHGSLGDVAPATIRLPRSLPTLRLSVPDGLLSADVLLPPDLVPERFRDPQLLLVGTDGSPEAVERARSALWPASGPPMTPAERAEQSAVSRRVTGYERAAGMGVLFALLVAGLSFAVTTIDSLRERRRGLATLVALGVPVRVLRRSVVLQTAVPLLPNMLLAVLVGVIGSVVYLGLVNEGVPLPWSGWSGVAAAAGAAVMLATYATLPFVRGVTRPEALRQE